MSSIASPGVGIGGTGNNFGGLNLLGVGGVNNIVEGSAVEVSGSNILGNVGVDIVIRGAGNTQGNANLVDYAGPANRLGGSALAIEGSSTLGQTGGATFIGGPGTGVGGTNDGLGERAEEMVL
jgi:hypothetical protein